MTSEIRANTLKNRVGLGTVSFTNTGPVVSGIVTATGATFTSGNVKLASDSQRLQLGSGQDLWMYHTGTSGGGHGLIQNDYGTMYMLSTNWEYRHIGTNQTTFKISNNQAVQLYYQNSSKLSTTNTGVTVQGLVSQNDAVIQKDLDVDGHTNLDNVSVAGVSTFSGVVRVPNGSAGAPAIHFGDSDSGVYGDSSNGVRLTAGGSDTIVATTNGVTFPPQATALTSLTLGSQSALSKPLYFADAASVQSASILLDNSSQELRIKNGRFSGQITFTTYNTEKARIESNGNFKVTTGTQYKGVNVCKADGGLVAELVGLSGSNDTGAVSLWSGGSKYVQISAVGNSYINGGSFGVGTASPGTSFVVEKSDASGLSAHILVNNSQSSAGISLLGSGSSFSSGGWAAVTDAGIIRSSANASNGLVLQAASGNLRFYAGGNPPAERLRIQSDGKLLIGSTNPSNNARLGNEICIVGTEAYTGMSITNYPGTNAAHAPLFDFNRSRGTSDQSLTSVVAGDKLGEIIFRGANGSAFADAVTLRAYADSVGGGHVDGRYEISTSQGGSMAIRFRVNENGHITAPNNVAFSARNGPSDVTNNVIIFGTLVFQRGGGNYDTSTGIFTAPVDGIYHFMCNPYRYETSSDSQIMLERSTNGGSSWSYEFEVRRTNNYDGDNGRGWSTLSLSQIMDLNANDQVRIRAINRVHCNGVYSRFSGFLVA